MEREGGSRIADGACAERGEITAATEHRPPGEDFCAAQAKRVEQVGFKCCPLTDTACGNADLFKSEKR